MYEVKKFDSIRELPGFSERMMTEHYKLYEGYVKKFNEATEKLTTVDLTTANASFSELRNLKLGYSFALSGIRDHEAYFSLLGGSGGKPTGAAEELIAKSFGSVDAWEADLKASGIAARGWVFTSFDWQLGKAFNFIADTHDSPLAWNSTLLLAMDVYEHAYFIDYGVRRADYITSFLANVSWDYVNAMIEKTKIMDKMTEV